MTRSGLQRRWRALCTVLGARGDVTGAFRELDRHYGAKGRFYHGWSHITDCLRELDRIRAHTSNPKALELALWFHDAVYEPGAANNEERSARLAAQWASLLGIDAEVSALAARLILATRHDRRGEGSNEDWIRDVDLAVLGSGSCLFRAYERRIRREYAGMPGKEYREGRAALLQGFLESGAIYATAYYRRRCERRARKNLAWARAKLLR